MLMQLVLHCQCWMCLVWQHLDDILECGHEHFCTVHHQCLGLGMSHYWFCRWWWQGVTCSWHHWGQIWFGQQWMEVSCSSLTGHGTLHFRWHIGWGSHVQHWHVGWHAWSIVAQWCVALTGITFLQVNASEHWLVCYSMLVELSMGLDQSTWHWVSNPLTILMAASARPLFLGFLGELVLWSNFQSVANSVKNALANWEGAIVSMEDLWDAVVCEEFPSRQRWSWRYCIEM